MHNVDIQIYKITQYRAGRGHRRLRQGSLAEQFSSAAGTAAYARFHTAFLCSVGRMHAACGRRRVPHQTRRYAVCRYEPDAPDSP